MHPSQMLLTFLGLICDIMSLKRLLSYDLYLPKLANQYTLLPTSDSKFSTNFYKIRKEREIFQIRNSLYLHGGKFETPKTDRSISIKHPSNNPPEFIASVKLSHYVKRPVRFLINPAINYPCLLRFPHIFIKLHYPLHFIQSSWLDN